MKVCSGIIDKFLDDNSEYFGYQTFDELLHLRLDPEVYRDYKSPFSAEDHDFISETTVYTPENKVHSDRNDLEFGKTNLILRIAMSTYMNMVLKWKWFPLMVYEDPSARIWQFIDKINRKDVYIDKQALKWWLMEHEGQKKDYNKVHKSVAKMYRYLIQKYGHLNLVMLLRCN